MKDPLYLLYRLNVEDRISLFQRPVRDNNDLVRVLTSSVDERCDYSQRSARSSWKWSIRDVIVGTLEESGREFVIFTFSNEIISRSGKIVTAQGVRSGVSEFNPPQATTIQVIVDLDRHFAAIEDVPAIMQSKPGWLKALETILGQAANWLEFTSRVRFTPIPPHQVVESRLADFSRVTRIRATLRIPNPDLSPAFRQLYEELKRGGVRELTEDIRSERGLDLSEGTLPRATLEMALGGYRKGKVHITGYGANGNKDEFTVADDVARLEGLKGFVDGLSLGARGKEAQRVARIIIERIEATFPRQLENDTKR